MKRIQFKATMKRPQFTLGSGLEFSIYDKESLVQSVPDQVADRLLMDHPDKFELYNPGAGKDEFVAQLRPKKVLLRKDQINDGAAKYFPGLKIEAKMTKAKMVAAILNEVGA